MKHTYNKDDIFEVLKEKYGDEKVEVEYDYGEEEFIVRFLEDEKIN